MISLHTISLLVTIVATIADIIAIIVVLLGANDRRVGRSFVVLASCLFFWSAFLVAESIRGVTGAHATLLRVLSLGLICAPAATIYSAEVWSGLKSRTSVALSCIIASVLSVLQLHDGLVAEGVTRTKWGDMGHPGPLFPVWGIFALGTTAVGMFACLRALSSPTEPTVRLRAKYWLLAAAAMLSLSLTNVAANYGLPFPRLASAGNIVLVGILTYAAVRYRVMDIDVFIMRAAATLLAGVAVVLPVAGMFIWTHHLPPGTSGLLVAGCLLLAALVSLFVFSRFRSYLERQVERSLFPLRHAARDAIRTLTAELVKLPLGTDLHPRLTAALRKGLGVNGVAVYRQGHKSRAFILAHVDGEVTAPPAIQEAGPPIVADGDPGPASDSAPVAPWEVHIPVRINGSQLGLIALGPKESGARIDDADLTLLNMVAAQLAIAMQNTEYVRQIEIQKAEIEELRKRLEAENISLRAEVRSVSQFKEIIGVSAALQRALVLVEKVAPTGAPIVITGETGTGKELIARAIHDLSPRRNGPLISVNCPAIPAGLAESELFGHERGAFTDAVQSRPGTFELADGGTIFLDEVADLSPDIQVKLLRVLQEHETQRIGSSKVRKLDLRVVAATNRDLHEEMRAGLFREDLYYRLAAVVVSVPPLRERTGDIPMLASYFLDRAATTYQKPVTGFSPEALDLLGRYGWPGNIRELQHVIERAVLLCTSDKIMPEHLAGITTSPSPSLPYRVALREEKFRRVAEALAQTGGNQAAAARLLGMSANNLARLMKNLGLKSPRAVH